MNARLWTIAVMLMALVWTASAFVQPSFTAPSGTNLALQEATSTLEPSPTAAPTPTAVVPSPSPQGSASGDPKEVLLAAFSSALAKIKTYRVQVPTEHREIEVVLPDRFHQLATSNWILIGNTLYMDMEIDGWRVLEVPAVPFFQKVNLGWYPEQITQSLEVKPLGSSQVDNIPSIGYETTVTLENKVLPTKIWFSTVDGLVHRIELGAPDSVQPILFSDFNADIIIEPPQGY